MSKLINTIIVDDEKPARDLIKLFLRDFPEISVVAECEDGFAALKAIKQYRPDLLFLDVQMPKLTGIEMLEVLDEPIAIIFSTAYDEYAVKAFEYNTIDYLLKPYSKARFASAIAKAYTEIEKGKPEYFQQIKQNLSASQAQTTDRLVVKEHDEIEILPLATLMYFEAQGDYVLIYNEKKRYSKLMTFKQLEQILDPQIFLRVHRSFVVQIKYIAKIERYTKDSFLCILKNGVKVPVSKSGYKNLKDTLGFWIDSIQKIAVPHQKKTFDFEIY